MLDTNVWLDLLLFDDPRTLRLSELVDASCVRLLASAATRAEWQRVLGYPQLGLDTPTQQRLLQSHDALAFRVDEASAAIADHPAVSSRLPRCRDPDDQMFLELAAGAGAVSLLTRDNALLELDRRCRRAAGFAVCRPETWLAGFSATDGPADEAGGKVPRTDR
ncbi:MAG: putative toxin-antitoxin system toxin component, PIN family [Xanthomonadales bacterium]|nr:putative toxin-antitoxin system toxin component, PIN family [Xanthomonadales bacterium]